MKTGALIIGILGGLIALAIGFIGYGLGSMANAGQAGSGSTLKMLSIGVPIFALVGAGMVMARPIIGATLMAGSAIIFVIVVGFNFISLVPVVLLGIGAFLGFFSTKELPENQTT